MHRRSHPVRYPARATSCGTGMVKRRKKRATLSHADAMQRVAEMIELIERDMKSAIALKATFQAANDIVQKEYAGKQGAGASCYAALMQSMALTLALTLARMFDPGNNNRPPNK